MHVSSARQGPRPRDPHAAPAVPGVPDVASIADGPPSAPEHAPELDTLVPETLATHPFGYVLPSHPQTTGPTLEQRTARKSWQVPGWSVAPQCADSGKMHVRPAAQRSMPRLPHPPPCATA